MKHRRIAWVVPVVMLALLAACGGSAVSPAEPEPEAPALSPAPGVEVKTLLTWAPDSQRVEIPLPAREGRLLVEIHPQTGQWTEVQLSGFDLTTGERGYFSPLGKFDGFECRQPLGTPGWEVKIFHGVSYWHDSWSGFLGEYTLPELLWEGRKYHDGRYDWDARPEQNLLTWTDERGLWLAAADGSGARLVLPVEEVAKQPDFAFWEEGTPLIFRCPRLMNGGRTVTVDFDVPGSPTGHIGLAVLEPETGKTDWYAPFANPLWGGLEYLDDVTLQAGFLQIDVVTRETKEVSRYLQTGPPYDVATTGDFSRYFACDPEEGLAVFVPSSGGAPETVLTATGYRKLSLAHAADSRRVLCEYEKPGESGLLLVTLPE